MKNNTIQLIVCTNNEMLMQECRHYIARLHMPEGYRVIVTEIADARSMCEGYNRAMQAVEAKIRIYLHQDVLILNRYLLENLLSIFEHDEKIGLVGMVGALKTPPSGIMWTTERAGKIYTPTDAPYGEEGPETVRICDVSSVDGFFMATAYDLPWREDLFDGFDFYDVSQSFEFRQKGYRVVVPEQQNAWCVHDDGRILNLFHYDQYRKIFLEHYDVRG